MPHKKDTKQVSTQTKVCILLSPKILAYKITYIDILADCDNVNINNNYYDVDDKDDGCFKDQFLLAALTELSCYCYFID